MHKPLFLISLSGGGFRAALYHAGVLRAHFESGAFELGSQEHDVIINAVSAGAIPAMVWNEFLLGDSEFQSSNPYWPEQKILNLVTTGPKFGGQWNWQFRGVIFRAQDAWLAHLIKWWNSCSVPVGRHTRLGLVNKPGLGQFAPIFFVEILDFYTGKLWTFCDQKLFRPSINYFKYGDLEASKITPVFDWESVPLAITAATAFHGYFPGVKLFNSKFMDAGLIDNLALYAFKPLVNVTRDGRGLKQGDKWFTADAGKPMAVTSDAEEFFKEKWEVVPKLGIFDSVFRLVGDLAQPVAKSVFLEAIKEYAGVHVFGSGIGFLPYEYRDFEKPWMTTANLQDETSIRAVPTSLYPLKNEDAVCVMAHGAQSASSALETPESVRSSIREGILGLAN